MKILKIQRNKLYLNNEEIIDVNKDIVSMFNLKKDMDISDVYEKIIFESMKVKSIYLIYLKERTEFQLKLKLKEKYSKDNYYLIDNVVIYLKELNYLDDFSYACSYIRINKAIGSNKLRYKLKEKGINDNIIRDAMDEVNSEIDLSEIERKNIQEFIKKNIKLEDEKLMRKLLNRGYRYDIVINEIKAKH